MNKNKKNIMIFGAGYLQESIIKTAKSLGYFTIVIDPDKNAYSKKVADKFFVIAGNDFKSTNDIINKYNIKAIVTTSTDKPLLMMSKIAEYNKLIFPSETSIINSTNKYLCKQILRKSRIKTADGIIVNNKIIYSRKIKNLKFPLVIKPVIGSGSRGVIFCKNYESLINNFEESVKYSDDGELILENYIDGKELSVESLTYNKKTQIIQITDKITSKLPYNVELGHTQPSMINKHLKDRLLIIVNRVIHALNLDNCASHIEFKINNRGIFLIEVGPRLGGDFITSHLVPLSTGINMEEAVINIALGIKPNICSRENKGAAIRYLNFKNGKIEKIRKWKCIFSDNNIVKADIFIKEGELVKKATNSLNRHGFVIAKGENRKSAIHNCNKAFNFIKSNVLIKE